MEKAVSIIILTWNGIEYTKQCLTALFENTIYKNYEVVVVDNGSKDGTIEYLESVQNRQPEKLHYIKNNKNLGFTRGNNIAIEKIKENDIVLLNNDVVIEQKDWLNKMQELAYQEETTGIVGCRMINQEGYVLHVGSYIRPDDMWGQQIGGGQKDLDQFCDNREVESVAFACVYIKQSLISKIGGLNEAFFSYFEDTDYCLRAKIAGFKTMYCGEVTILHYQNVSVDKNKQSFSKMFLKSQRTFKKLWKKEIERVYKKKILWYSNICAESIKTKHLKNTLLYLDENKINIALKERVIEPDILSREWTEHRIRLMRNRKRQNRSIEVYYEYHQPCLKKSKNYQISYSFFSTEEMTEEWLEYLKNADEIWVTSHANKKFLLEKKVVVPIYVYPQAVNIHYFYPKEKSLKKHNTYTFLFVIEKIEIDFLEYLLELQKEIFSKKRVSFLVYTRQPLSYQVQNFIKKKQEEGQAFFLGILVQIKEQEAERSMLYQYIDCLVIPKKNFLSAQEIVLETLACGIPVIMSMKEREQIELLKELQIGYDYQNQTEMILGIQKIYEEQEEVKEKMKYTAEKIRELYSYEKLTEQMAKHLQEIKV